MNSQKLKTTVLTIVAITFAATVSFTNAQSKGPNINTGHHGSLFVDANGDGICDNFNNPGVIPPKDGTGNKYGTGNKNANGKGFGMKHGNGSGVCDGTGKGTGKGGGICDGTGPKGKMGGK